MTKEKMKQYMEWEAKHLAEIDDKVTDEKYQSEIKRMAEEVLKKYRNGSAIPSKGTAGSTTT